jgi:hypothetical protein
MTVFPQKLQRIAAPAFSKFNGAPHEGHLKGCVIFYFKILTGQQFSARRRMQPGFAARQRAKSNNYSQARKP